jgi:hypothetical protein
MGTEYWQRAKEPGNYLFSQEKETRINNIKWQP